MDRNEVILVGRLPEAAHIRLLPSGSRLGTWRLIVRRQHRGRGARVDTIPCASFELEVIEAVAGWLPDDTVEVTGSLRRRWWGSEGAKSSGYEVEARSVRRLERRVTTILTGDEGVPAPAPPRSVHSLLHAGEGDTGQGGAGQGGESRLTPVKTDLTSAGPALAPTGPDATSPGGPDSAEAGLDVTLTGPDSAEARPDVTLTGPDSAEAGLDVPSAGPDLAQARPDVTLAGGSDSAQAGPDVTSVEPDSALAGSDLIGLDSDLVRRGLVSVSPDPDPVRLGLTPVGRDPASEGPDDLTQARSDIAPEGVPVSVQRAVEVSISGRSQVPHLAARADAVSGSSE